MRLAWFSPWPPQHSGIAGRSAELVAALAARGHAIDVFLDEQDPDLRGLIRKEAAGPTTPGTVRLHSAHDFVWRAAQHQYDLPVYQIGNSRLHEFIWPYLFRWPGLTVLHDARLHHARGRALLRAGRAADYRDEFAWAHEGTSVDLAELAVRGFRGPYYYQWPMTRAVVASSRITACHSRGAAAELREQFPDAQVEYIALGEGAANADVPAMRRAFRSRHRIDDDVVVFGVHGALTAEKRLPQVLRAFASARRPDDRTLLLLAGEPDPSLRIEDEIASLGLEDAVRLVSGLNDDEFDAAIAACDVCLNLRWPTALETSGPWVRALSMSRATVIVDLVHQGHVPVLDPRTWKRHAPTEDLDPDADLRAIAVAVDILDEEHSLTLAIRRLSHDAGLRHALGTHARAYWEREHTVDRMVADFERLASLAASRPSPTSSLPVHLRPDPAAHASALLAPFDLATPLADVPPAFVVKP